MTAVYMKYHDCVDWLLWHLYYELFIIEQQSNGSFNFELKLGILLRIKLFFLANYLQGGQRKPTNLTSLLNN